LRQAVRDAVSLLPSRDAKKNERFKLGLYLAVGLPIWTALASAVALAGTTGSLGLGTYAAFFLASLVGPIATTFLAALPLTLAFYGLQGEETRGRLRQALVCPYCRDEVGREGAVICARSRCGALYHDECWRECGEHYGGCAIYGCSSKKSHEVSATGYILRLARLGVAALLFPPRVARAITSSERESFLAIYRKAARWTNRIAVSPDSRENPPWKMALYVFVSMPIAFALVIAFIHVVTPETRSAFSLEVFFRRPWGFAAFWALTTGIAFVLPRLVALPPALALYTYRAVAEVLKSELAALARGDAGGGTVLGRLAAGFGKKALA
jgi:hypothetical protein